MLTWRLRPTGTRRRVEPRIGCALLLMGVWLAVGIFLTFAFEWQISNVWARLGLYGKPIPGIHPRFDLEQQYPAARVTRVNAWIEDYGNMVLLTPLAVLLPLLRPKVRWWQVALCGLLLSSAIETSQLFIGGRVAQVSDVVVNTAGVTVAAIVVAVLRWVWRVVAARRSGRREVRRPDAGPAPTPEPAGASVPARGAPTPTRRR